MSWQDTVKRAIAEDCEAARKAARGKRKKHVPYRVPDIAQAMVQALNEDNEHEAKRLLHIRRVGALSLI
jgi:hypothetical protein